jgi:ribosomal protein L18
VAITSSRELDRLKHHQHQHQHHSHLLNMSNRVVVGATVDDVVVDVVDDCSSDDVVVVAVVVDCSSDDFLIASSSSRAPNANWQNRRISRRPR